MKHFVAAALACASLGACTLGEWHSINRQFAPTTGDSRLIDAKQRAILSVLKPAYDAAGRPVPGPDGFLTNPVVCAEPSPDALQATAAALSGSGNFSQGDIEAAFRAAAGSNEGAASIGLRTQSIQLLRDAYYRICEGYASGALDAVSYDTLQRRFQNHMIALLAVEQLTGVVRAEQVALTSTTAADAGADLGALNAELRRQREELNELQKRKAALDEEIDALEHEGGGAPESPELKAKKADRTTIEAQIADQKAVVADLETAVEKASEKTLTTGTTTSAVTVLGDTTGEVRGDVTAAVREITLQAMTLDYSAQVCFETLRRQIPTVGTPSASAFGGGLPTGPDADLLRQFCRERFAQLVRQKQMEADTYARVSNAMTEEVAARAQLLGQAAQLLKAGKPVPEWLQQAVQANMAQGVPQGGAPRPLPGPAMNVTSAQPSITPASRQF